MRPEDPIAAVERRRNQIRVVLFLIILFTLPFYPLGVWLWLSAPDDDVQTVLTEAPTETSPPLDNTATEAITNTPRPSSTAANPLDPTPIQVFPVVTRPPISTSAVIPTSTPAPSLTAAPTNTLLPTFTPIPPTNPPLPTNTPPPTATPLPPPSNTPQPEVTTEAQP